LAQHLQLGIASGVVRSFPAPHPPAGRLAGRQSAHAVPFHFKEIFWRIKGLGPDSQHRQQASVHAELRGAFFLPLQPAGAAVATTGSGGSAWATLRVKASSKLCTGISSGAATSGVWPCSRACTSRARWAAVSSWYSAQVTGWLDASIS